MFVFVRLLFVTNIIEADDPNKVEEKQASETGESEEKRDKTKEELEKESAVAKEDEKKASSKSKELEQVPSKTKGPTVSGYACSSFATAHTFCAARVGLRKSDFLRKVSTNSKVF